MSNTTPQTGVTSLEREKFVTSSAVSGQVGIVALNPDGSSISGGSLSTLQAGQEKIVSLTAGLQGR